MVLTGIAERSANAILIKMNQIGTITETLDVVARARAAGFRTVISARSGDGTVLKASFFGAARTGPGVLLLHQGNRQRKAWDGLASRLAAAARDPSPVLTNWLGIARVPGCCEMGLALGLLVLLAAVALHGSSLVHGQDGGFGQCDVWW